MRTVLLSPVNRGNAVELGRKTFKKQILKKGSLDYEGRRIDFDDRYLTDLANAFKEGAFDAVPFQLADAGNAHTNDPERTRGEVIGLEVTPDGLDAIVELTDDGAQVVENNPKLGVSARIIEGVKHAMGGQAWPRAIQHVLGTLDPRVTGMRPWEAIQLAADATGETVVDLTDATYIDDVGDTTGVAPAAPSAAHDTASTSTGSTDTTHEEGAVPDVKDQKPGAQPDVTGSEADQLTDEELEQILAEVEAEFDTAATGDTDPDGPGQDDPDAENDDEEDDGEETVDGDEGAEESLAALANDGSQGEAIELANAQLRETRIELARLRDESDENAYTRERDALARECGIPPRIVDMAKPLLKGDSHVISLANGDEVDAGAIVRQVFTELGNTIKALDLSAELGHQVDLAKSEQERQAAEAEEADRRKFSEDARSAYTF